MTLFQVANFRFGTDLHELLDESVGHIAICAKDDRFVMRALRRVLDALESRARDKQDI